MASKGEQPTLEEAGAIRRAEPADVATLTRMLVRAYMDDPIAVWMCESSGLRAKLLESLYSARLRAMLVDEGVWVNRERSSAAVWTPPGGERAGIRPNAALIGCVLNPRLMARLPLLALGFSRMQRRHPRTPPHWYLSLLGTDPGAQGHGFGSAVLQPVLERCDADGVGAYLESSKPRNLGFYAHHGFRIVGELQLPRGPRMWPMWRDPRDGGH
jgi:ribosomal protein S18 acetylase RimI-like enzyme